MYISQVIIGGYRNFKDAKFPLHDGINVIIGANNSGKSNLLQAVALTLNVNHYVNVDDIFCETDVAILQKHSPIVSISLLISQSETESDTSEEAGLLGGYMNTLQSPYEAQINFQYSLSSDKEEQYLRDVEHLSEHKDIWSVIKKEYARFYETYRWGGNGPAAKANLNELFEKCDFQFLEALRDVGRDMYMGYNPMLRDVLNFFIDYRIKISQDKTEDDIKEELRSLQLNFKEQAKPLINLLLNRLEQGKNILLDYAKDTGASFGNVEPDFSGDLTEAELFAVLRLVIRYETGVEIPATHNGLGYNNLIYMSLLLAKMQATADGSYMGRQAKLYSLLAIEEPEAHLHPAMQYQLLDFLNKNRQKHNVNQIIVTTHSTQIVSAVSVDDIICLNHVGYGVNHTAYPRLEFKNTPDDNVSKAYVQRYLDATRSDMFFADKLIFVEGAAEEILLPTLAKYLGYNLTKEHVLVVNMGGRYYNHFLKMFKNDFYGMAKKVACITDIDPCCEDESCYPYEYGMDNTKKYSHHADDEMNIYSTHPYVRYFRQDAIFGKTLEYDIALVNNDTPLIIVDGMKNETELKDLIKKSTLDEMKDILRESKENTAIKLALDACNWDVNEKKKALFASRYLNSVSKGGNALSLSLVLEANFKKAMDDPTKMPFNVPQYISDALTWLFA